MADERRKSIKNYTNEFQLQKYISADKQLEFYDKHLKWVAAQGETKVSSGQITLDHKAH